MAFKSSSQANIASGGIFNLTAPAGFAAHDRAFVVISQDDSTASFTAPSGWVSIGKLISNADGQTSELFELIDAAGTESFNFTSDKLSVGAIQALLFSGVSNSIPITVSRTVNSSAASAPYSTYFNNVNTTKGNNLVAISILDTNTASDTWSFTPPTGFTSTTSQNATSTAIFASIKTADYSGILGTLTGTVVGISTPSAYSACSSFLLSIPLASSPSTASSVRIASRLYGPDYLVSNTSPSNGLLAMGWFRQAGATAPPHGYDRFTTFSFFGTNSNLYFDLVGGNSYDTTSTGADISARSDIQISNIVGTSTYGGQTSFIAQNNLPYTNLERWVWTAAYINFNNTTQSAQIYHYFIIDSGLYSSLGDIPYSDLRANAVSNSGGAWVDPGYWNFAGFDSFTLGQTNTPFDATHVKIYSGVTTAPTEAQLVAYANARTPDTSAWGDWRLTYATTANLADSSGHGRDLATSDVSSILLEGTPGLILDGSNYPTLSLPSLINITSTTATPQVTITI